MQNGALIILKEDPEPGDTVIITGDGLSALQERGPRLAMAVTVISRSGGSFRARIVSLEEDRASLLVFEKMAGSAESKLSITLLQALPEKERMELIIEKTTELGVDVVVPWKAEKGITLAERDARQQKSVHWQKRANKAAKQCRRARVPSIMPFTSLEIALEQTGDCGLRLSLSESYGSGLQEVLRSSSEVESIGLLVGPEGGLVPRELELAEEAGFVPVRLGARILRTETAAIVAVAIAQYVLGDLGGG